MNAAVLTISDSAYKGLRADASGPALRERLERLGWNVCAIEVLPDEKDQIAALLATLSESERKTLVRLLGKIQQQAAARNSSPTPASAAIG